MCAVRQSTILLTLGRRGLKPSMRRPCAAAASVVGGDLGKSMTVLSLMRTPPLVQPELPEIRT